VVVVELVDGFVRLLRVEAITLWMEGMCEELSDDNIVGGEGLRKEAVEHHSGSASWVLGSGEGTVMDALAE
jgi:hypothetical protein